MEFRQHPRADKVGEYVGPYIFHKVNRFEKGLKQHTDQIERVRLTSIGIWGRGKGVCVNEVKSNQIVR